MIQRLFILILVLSNFLLVKLTHAQAPQGFPYQAVARSNAGNLLAGQSISIRISVLDLSSSGTVLYRETHSVTTNSLGLFTINVGQGTVTLGTFAGIAWGSGAKYIKVDMDANGGSSYTTMGTSQLLSVPYALYANVPGVAGPQGTAGVDGKTVLNGTTNPTAGTGVNGDFYINTTNDQIFGPKTGGVWGTGTSLIGPQGIQGIQGIQGTAGTNGTNGANGVDGKTILNGTTNPTAGTGVNGDFYINTTSDQIFGPKAGGVWGTGTSLIGPQGIQGAAGTNGVDSLKTVNGISRTGDSVKLGGRLSEATVISQDGFPFQIKEIDSTTTNLEISQTSFSQLTNLGSTASTQTYTAIQGTKLSSIRLRLTATAGSTVTLAIKNSAGVVMNTSTISFPALFDNWQTFGISNNVVQTMGAMYTLSVTGSAGTTWHYSGSNVYAGGQSSVNANRDFAFETYVFTDVSTMYITNLKVGIGNTNPASKLDVTGKIRTTLFQLTNNPTNGYVLVSDANGNGSWQNAETLFGGNLNDAYNYGGAGMGRTIMNNNGAVKISGQDGFIVNGNFGSGDTIEPQNGASMYFNPKKAAFRAGRVNGDMWNNSNIGIYSAAFGSSSIASGSSSFAAGSGAKATGNSAIAIGSISVASGDNTIALGMYADAFGEDAVSIGESNEAVGDNSLALGSFNEAKGNRASVAGFRNIANGFTEFVIGQFNDTVVSAQATMLSTTPLFTVGNGTSYTMRSNVMTARNDGRVGIGTSAPLARLHVHDSSVVFTSSGNIATGPIHPPPVSGAGKRMQWYGDKAALQAGYVSGANWDKDSIGKCSVAMGNNTMAKGANSFAGGKESKAAGDEGFAFGYYNVANGHASIAMGFESTANGDGSVVIGDSNLATGLFSNAFGTHSTAKGFYTSAIGEGLIANAYSAVTLGRYNDSIVAINGNSNSTSPTFIIGNGTSNANRTNALVVRHDGRMGLGVNAPLHQLELSTNSAAKPSSSTWTISSDARLKNIDGNYAKGLNDILKLNTIQYHYKEDNARRLPSNEQSYGFIAQEVQKVFPECVKENEDGYLSLDLHPILVSYINGFKELNEKNVKMQLELNETKLQTQMQLNELKQQNDILSKRLNAIENK